jgi:anti-sigma factor RsiW
MSTRLQDGNDCRPELIPAYIDGDLDHTSSEEFEQHVRQCTECSSELRLQRLLSCELQAALQQAPVVDIPVNFARVVAVQAETDMRGTRNGEERRRAIRFCLVLAAASFALIGVAASRNALYKAESIGTKFFSLAGLFARALYDVGAGVAITMRVTGRALFPEAFYVLGLLLLLLLVLLLSILISGYHRYSRQRLFQ